MENNVFNGFECLYIELFLLSLILIDEGLELFKKAEKYHENWIKLYLEGNTSETLTNLGQKLLKQYLEALKKLSSTLSKQVAEYDIYSMTVGAIITLEVRIGIAYKNVLCF